MPIKIKKCIEAVNFCIVLFLWTQFCLYLGFNNIDMLIQAHMTLTYCKFEDRVVFTSCSSCTIIFSLKRTMRALKLGYAGGTLICALSYKDLANFLWVRHTLHKSCYARYFHRSTKHINQFWLTQVKPSYAYQKFYHCVGGENCSTPEIAGVQTFHRVKR